MVGRKPLILVRASILGMLMPASGDAKKDREIFLRILTMDDEGVWQRLKPAARRKTSHTAFDSLTYAERIKDCERPENVDGPTPEAWADINAHLGTTAASLPELVEQLGQRSFGHTPRVGDAFCGGGSIPFEAARIGGRLTISKDRIQQINPQAKVFRYGQDNTARRQRRFGLAQRARRVRRRGKPLKQLNPQTWAIARSAMLKAKDGEFFFSDWLRNRNTLEFIGVWEQIHNPDFKGLEFETFKNQAGLNSFSLTPSKWIEATGAIGFQSKAGRYGGGTYAHKDIAFEFGSWLSPEFKLYLIKEFQRLKDDENDRLKLD